MESIFKSISWGLKQDIPNPNWNRAAKETLIKFSLSTASIG